MIAAHCQDFQTFSETTAYKEKISFIDTISDWIYVHMASESVYSSSAKYVYLLIRQRLKYFKVVFNLRARSTEFQSLTVLK